MPVSKCVKFLCSSFCSSASGADRICLYKCVDSWRSLFPSLDCIPTPTFPNNKSKCSALQSLLCISQFPGHHAGNRKAFSRCYPRWVKITLEEFIHITSVILIMHWLKYISGFIQQESTLQERKYISFTSGPYTRTCKCYFSYGPTSHLAESLNICWKETLLTPLHRYQV